MPSIHVRAPSRAPTSRSIRRWPSSRPPTGSPAGVSRRTLPPTRSCSARCRWCAPSTSSTEATMARVALEHVDKVYPGGTRALSDCTLAVEDGELVVVVGPSGCGKSTVLRIVAGLESVTAGIVRIGDRVANDLPPQERNAAMVFQDYALYPYLTARGNLEFPLRMRRLARGAIRDRVEAIAR